MLRKYAFYLASCFYCLSIYSVNAQTLPRVQQSDLSYLGAFRVPATSHGSSSFHYGGTAIAFNPANQSLFIVGHDHQQDVAEIKIPTNIVNSSNANSLATATVLQAFTDATEGKLGQIDVDTVKVGGLLVYGDKLVGTGYSYYDGDANATLSHFDSSPDLSVKGEVRGMYRLGSVGAGHVGGYMTHVPTEWQSQLGGTALTGQCCLSIIGRSSSGPAVSVFNPADIGTKNPIPATSLVGYPLSNPLANPTSANTLYNLATSVKGVAFPGGTSSVLFFGAHGQGEWCYGPGTSNMALVGTIAPGGIDPYCYDPADGSKGQHSYPYLSQVWAYAVEDLLSVKNGQKQSWQIKPYATWDLNLPFKGGKNLIGGAAYDSASRRLYISQLCSDPTAECNPIIHVLNVRQFSSETLPPSAPANLRAVAP